jgi:hypothetical protein
MMTAMIIFSRTKKTIMKKLQGNRKEMSMSEVPKQQNYHGKMQEAQLCAALYGLPEEEDGC